MTATAISQGLISGRAWGWELIGAGRCSRYIRFGLWVIGFSEKPILPSLRAKDLRFRALFRFLYARCDPMIGNRLRSNATPTVLIAATALAVVLPFLKLGIPSGHDFEFHMNSWIEVVEHWKQGTIYPHWAAMAHYGYGEARFIFYPPFSWILGGLLGLILPWKLVPAVYTWIVLTGAGWSMFVLARRWLSRGDAIFAAMFYTANLYNLVIVYWRSAQAELIAAAQAGV